MSLALANTGDMQIELIQQHDDNPSAWRDFRVSGHEGFQHMSSWLTRAEYDETLARMGAAGTMVLHEGVVPGIGERFAYLATDTGPGGFLFEIADVIDTSYPMMETIAEAARGWDGSDPIRDLKL